MTAAPEEDLAAGRAADGPRPGGLPDLPASGGPDGGHSPWPAPYPPTYLAGELPASWRPPRGRRLAATAIGVVLLVVLCGAVGAVAGRIEADRQGGGDGGPSLLVPQASFPVTGPSLPTTARSGSVAAIAAAVLPSVVTVRVANSSEQGTGSGVLIRPDGYILTNNHVVAPGLKSNGTLVVDLSATDMNVPAKVVGRSPSDDLAVIKISRTGLRAARLGNSSALQVGDAVVAVGAPLGLSGSVTSGIVSALNRNVDVPEEGGASASAVTVLGNAIQTDAAINPGNSGGALVDSSGAVVGINSAIASLGSGSASSQSGSIGVGFALPIDYAISVATQIIRTGTVTHPYLGISVSSIPRAQASAGGPDSGALVRSVVGGSPAATAGIRDGDVVTALQGRPVTSADDLIVATRAYRIGQTVQLRLLRGGTTITVPVKLAQNPND